MHYLFSWTKTQISLFLMYYFNSSLKNNHDKPCKYRDSQDSLESRGPSTELSLNQIKINIFTDSVG
jgi:hypothetical protein